MEYENIAMKGESEQTKNLKKVPTQWVWIEELCLKSEEHEIKVSNWFCAADHTCDVSRALLAVWKYIPVQKYSFQFLFSTVFTKTLVLVSTGGFSNCVNLRWSVILTLSGSCSGNLFKFYSSQRHNAQNRRHQQGDINRKRTFSFIAQIKSKERLYFHNNNVSLLWSTPD